MWSMPVCVGSSRAELGHEQSALYEKLLFETRWAERLACRLIS